jgi:hypothetical protein
MNTSNYTIVEDIFEGEDMFTEPNPMRNTHKITGSVTERMTIPDLPPQRGNHSSSMNRPPINHHPSPSLLAPQLQLHNIDEIQCRQVFHHIENCPICSGYLKRDIKFYWFVIFVLVCVILYLTRK